MLLQNIQQVNQDLQIRQNFLHPKNSDLAPTRSATSSPYNLMQALIKRNQTYAISTDPKSLPKLPEPLRVLTQQTLKQIKLTKMQEQTWQRKQQQLKQISNQIQHDKFTYVNQENYVTKHEQYHIQGLVIRSFQKSKEISKKLKMSVLNRMKGNCDIGAREEVPEIVVSKKSKIRRQEEVQGNFQKYLEFVKSRVLANQIDMDGSEYFQMLGGEVATLWQTLSQHFKAYNYAKSQQKPNPKLALPLYSISILQQKFRQQLTNPQNERQLREQIRKKYLVTSSSTLNTFSTMSHSSGTPPVMSPSQETLYLWAVPYTLYRAGLKTLTYLSLNQKGRVGSELKQELIKFEDSLTDYYPSYSYFGQASIEDKFYRQLVGIVKGACEYDEKLGKIGELDFLWLVLKCISVYRYTNQNKEEQLQQVSDALLQYFLLHLSSLSKAQYVSIYQQFLYLSDYKNFALFHKNSPLVNEKLAQQDIIHLYICLASKKQLLSQQQMSLIEEELSIQLTSFLIKMLNGKWKQYAIFYLLQVPALYFQSVILKVFHSYHQFSIVNECHVDNFKGWQFLKFRYSYYLKQQIFQHSISSLLNTLISQESSIGTKYQLTRHSQQLLTTPRLHLNLLLQCQCQLLKNQNIQQIQKYMHKINHKVMDKLGKYVQMEQEEELEEGEGEEEGEIKLGDQFGTIVVFLRDFVELCLIRGSNNNNKIQNYLRNQKYVRDLPLILKKDNTKSNSMLNLWKKLDQFDALELFFRYALIVVQAEEKIGYLRANTKKVDDYKQTVLKTFANIKSQRLFKIDRFENYMRF